MDSLYCLQAREMRLLITGSTGFIGKNLLLRALNTEAFSKVITPVRNADKLHSFLAEEGWKGVPPQLHILPSSPKAWSKRVECDVVIHCAGLLFGRSLDEYRSVNVEGTLQLCRALPASTKMILLSSQSAGGPTPCNDLTRAEDTPDAPLTYYGKSKKEMERRCLSEFADRDIIVLRPPMVLGARDQATLPLFRLAAQRIRPKPGFRSKHYSFISVKDLCMAIFVAMKRDTQKLQRRVFYVSHPTSITDYELIEYAGKVLGKKGWPLPLPQKIVQTAAFFFDAIPALRNKVPSFSRDRAQEIWANRWVLDGSQFEKTFRFFSEVGLEESLSDAWEWYKIQKFLKKTRLE